MATSGRAWLANDWAMGNNGGVNHAENTPAHATDQHEQHMHHAMVEPGFPGTGQVVGNGLRGALMGMAELVPGVSGGTVALVTGIYERILYNGSLVVDALKGLVTGPERGAKLRYAMRHLDWWLLIPLALCMVLAVFGLAGVMHDFVEGSPEVARSLFAGMVFASIAVPWMMARETGYSKLAVVAIAVIGGFAAAFFLSSLSGGTIEDPAWYVVFGAAAIAICALALPGVSGSYLLMAMGLYSATTKAADELDLGYLGVFAAGAFVGIACFIKGLNFLLDRYRAVTLYTMAGLMAGSLRALWPWQDDEANVQGVGDNWPMLLGVFALGIGIVVVVLLLERVYGNTKKAQNPRSTPVEG